MPLVTGVDVVARYDARRVCDLVGDAGVRADPATVAANDNLLTIVDDAIDMLLSAVRVASRYSTADLEVDPPPAVGGTGKPLVKRIVADLTFGLLTARRGYSADEQGKLSPRYFEALQLLEQIRRGDRIFDVDAAAAAGLPGTVNIDDAVGRPNFIADHCRFFGYRSPPLYT